MIRLHKKWYTAEQVGRRREGLPEAANVVVRKIFRSSFVSQLSALPNEPLEIFSTRAAIRNGMSPEPSEEIKRAFRSIEGWIELRNYDEAANELHALPPEFKSTTSFVKAWIRIYEAQKAWSNVELLATTLRKQKPNDLFGINKLAESQFQQGRPHEAIGTLGEALANAPRREHPLVRYNLARYFCAAGQSKEARECLRGAIDADRTLRKRALDDPDLRALWTEEQDGRD